MLLIINFAYAKPAPTDVVLNISGRILEPAPCVISGTGDNGIIGIHFGDVKIDEIDGQNYRRQIDYEINCVNNRQNELVLTIKGTPAGFDTALLGTDIGDLGIIITNDSKLFPVNSFVDVDLVRPAKPILYAAPMARPGAILTGRPFSATAIMQVYYQ